MNKFANIIRELERLCNNRVFIGVSGGADSLALLLLAIAAKLNVEAVSFEHGIRGEESIKDAEFTRDFCAERGVHCRIIPLNVPGNMEAGENLEAAARRLRIAAWEKLLAEEPNAIILLGHHADDAAENLLLRVGRGGNLSSLTNLRREKQLGKLRVIRPLLQLCRAQIEEFLQEQHVDFRTDSTNLDTSYQRNYIRHKILTPWMRTFPPVAGGIAASLSALMADAEFIETEAGKRFDLIAGKDSTPFAFWQDQPDAMLYRLLTRYFELPALTIGTMARVKRFLAGDGRACQIGMHQWQRERDELVFAPLPPGTPPAAEWCWRQEPTIRWGEFLFTAILRTGLPPTLAPDASCAYFNADELPNALDISVRNSGERMRTFAGKQKSIKDLFINAKLTQNEKTVHPIVRANGVIAWVPGIANSDLAPASPTGKTVILRVATES